MSVTVFCGPTVSAREVAEEIEADVRPPAMRGDVLRAALERPAAIVLIDGYFDRVPSVWHKEILWAMSEGIHVFGAGSMGALRAAELVPFGMVGVGEIVEAFRNGELEDDDEVAVAHADAELGYRSLSEAMVNIRWTLRAATAVGVISETTCTDLTRRAKALLYDVRDLRWLLGAAEAGGVSRQELTALRDWLPSGRVDQKKRDALVCLRHVAALARAGWGRKTVAFRFAETDGWMALRAEVEATCFDRTASASDRALEDELRARGMLGRTLVAATMRCLAERRFRDARVALNPRAVEAWIDEFRRDRELHSAAAFDGWLRAAEVDDTEAEQFFRREAAVLATRSELRCSLSAFVRDELRASGELQGVLGAARTKEELLSKWTGGAPSLVEAGLTEGGLWTWFFGAHLQTTVPPSVGAYAASEASSVDELRTSALRAYLARQERTTPHEEGKDPCPWPPCAT
jgi:hypothetical protein